jgi:3-mercaptopyruvate sulfurtransferase SseA/sterol desaturase/sphingolipid hydroxylase (fatty acid hydroxylase superfamily)
MMATRKQMEELLTSLNIGVEDKIVAYDDKGGCDAARVWWIMQVFGNDEFVPSKNFRILDGGIKAWGNRNEAYEIFNYYDYVRDRFQFPAESNESRWKATESDVQAALKDKNTILVDTRSTKEFTGEEQKDGAFRAGHIPGAIHFDWVNCLNDEDKIKTPEELKPLFVDAGITPDKKIITYCHSGVRSAHTTFVLSKILNYPNVVNYDGSWVEWSFNEKNPIDTGAALSATDSSALAGAHPGYWETFKSSFGSFASYTWREITFQVSPWYVNYFWWLIVLSLGVWALEVLFPWRKNQAIIRKDFWLDAFYMFFNFYIFKLVIFMAFSNVTELAFKDLFGGDLSKFALFDLSATPVWAQLLIFFVATDFIQWFTHILLHRFNFLWRFHKVHHSVEQMGFAAHLRYHWMENVFYTPMKYIVVMLMGGFTPELAYIVFYIAIAIGHLNHANLNWSYGPLKYIFNNPKMHIWHHAYALPENRRHGVNFGISLSIWDYIFRTNFIPTDGRDIPLGFPGLKQFPKTFFGQLFYGFGRSKNGTGNQD